MKQIMLIIFILILLTGCGGTGNVITDMAILPTGEIVSAATDRWGSWERVRAIEEKTKQEFAKAETAKAEAEKVEFLNKESTVITISDKDAMAIYALHEANKSLAKANAILGKVALALSNGGSPYKDLVSYTPVIQGAFAEGFDSIFGGAAKVLNTPVAGLIAGGWAAKELVNATGKNSGSTFNTEGGDVNAQDSFNRSDVKVGDNSDGWSIKGNSEETTTTTTETLSY